MSLNTPNVVWTIEATLSFTETISNIFSKWNLSIVEKFEQLVYDLINRLGVHQELCPPSSKSGYRKCVVSEQTSLIYRIRNERVELMLFIDNRSNNDY